MLDHVKPNESLGKAIKYMLKHWEKLTRFLQIPGTPITLLLTSKAPITKNQ
ncbi:IS66 family transposase [Legionella pneumophila]|uniref:IS66 family transposase n=1 Tax=Legionella pneumophila TaxID=446 RepID=UPI0036D6D3D0